MPQDQTSKPFFKSRRRKNGGPPITLSREFGMVVNGVLDGFFE